MKFCTIICEYNPFHNGHRYQLAEAKARSNTDATLCLMSGNFVQRGEASVCDKFTRAKHAVLGGADIVLELPTLFATSNAELFAKGAISILSKIPSATTLCFGAETADKPAFLSAARLLKEEPKEVSQKLKELISSGVSYAKARAEAWAEFLPKDLLHSPNNILGLEYTKAIIEQGASLDILPIQRMGGGYREETLQPCFSSASAIRKAISQKEDISAQVPDFVAKDLQNDLENHLEILEKYALLIRSKEEIASVCDCKEGLENAFKKAAEKTTSLVEELTSARYTSSRIRRIALQNLLGISEALIRQALQAPLYLRVLAINKEKTDLLSALAKSNLPLLIRANDVEQLTGVAKQVYEIDIFAEKIYNLLYPTEKNNNIFI
ncbi:MAG: nucleotidyltransferase family protein [Clostridia bacterium]|nr:nucleotidyltransferase family protein [Clostridia bacterium]